MADKDQVDMPLVRLIARKVGVRTLPDVAKYGEPAKAEVQRVIQESIAGLKAGENLLMYPAGHLARTRIEDLGGASALSTILEQVPDIDLVICDLEMPRMDGMQLIGEMAARRITPQLIIVSSTEIGILESVRHMALSYGFPMTGFVSKPLDLCKLFDVFNLARFWEDPISRPWPVQARGISSAREIRHGMDNGEFECFFQPQLSMAGADLKGAEALLRWRHPDLGLLGPAAFLPQIEKDPELMSSLTLRVLEQIARQWNEWNAAGLPMALSINLSASSLGLAGFSDRILDVVTRYDLSPSRLVLEITESASISNLGQTLANLARLRMRGFKLSIDDFGTGYATYQQLERIPFTELKIDISITRELPRSRKQTLLAKNLIQLAKDLDLIVVAEGIETQECWDALQRLGCDRGQGYFLSRPMPSGHMHDWANQDRSHLLGVPLENPCY